jgi:hypothetical protein
MSDGCQLIRRGNQYLPGCKVEKTCPMGALPEGSMRPQPAHFAVPSPRTQDRTYQGLLDDLLLNAHREANQEKRLESLLGRYDLLQKMHPLYQNSCFFIRLLM